MPEHKALYRMPDKEAAVLRNICKVGSNDQLPQALLDVYWGVRNVCGKINLHTIPDFGLALIAYVAGCGLEPPPPPSLVDLWQQGEIKIKTPVEFKYRDTWQHFGKLVNLNIARRMFAIQGDDGMRYEIHQDDVRVIEADAVATA